MKTHPVYWRYAADAAGNIYGLYYNKRFMKMVPREVPIRLKPKLSRGYYVVSVMHEGRKLCRSVHRLVLECFVGPCPEGKECAHRNGIRTDNRRRNLVWKTTQENADDRHVHKTVPHGEDVAASKLTWDDVTLIRASTESERELGRQFGVSSTTIHNIRHGRIWKESDRP